MDAIARCRSIASAPSFSEASWNVALDTAIPCFPSIDRPQAIGCRPRSCLHTLSSAWRRSYCGHSAYVIPQQATLPHNAAKNELNRLRSEVVDADQSPLTCSRPSMDGRSTPLSAGRMVDRLDCHSPVGSRGSGAGDVMSVTTSTTTGSSI